MAGMVGNIALAEQAPARRRAFAIKPCRTGGGAPSGERGPASRRSEVRIPSAPQKIQRYIERSCRRPRVLNKENADHWIGIAAKHSKKEINELVKKHLVASGEAVVPPATATHIKTVR
jgi:hypothetical protein